MTLTSLFEHTFHNFSKAPQQKGLLLHHPKHKVFESLQTEIDIPKIVQIYDNYRSSPNF